jgi:hypothetical protein
MSDEQPEIEEEEEDEGELVSINRYLIPRFGHGLLGFVMHPARENDDDQD